MKRWVLPLAASLLLIAASPSDECMHCHDGSAARAVRPSASHKVGIEYARANALKFHLRPLAVVPQGVLIAGRVECTSCHAGHDVNSDRPFRLTKPLTQLCLSCHDL